MRTIAIVNQKGGCGKTTTAINLSAFLAREQRRVLLIDMDPQGHATLGLLRDPSQLSKTVYEVLAREQGVTSLRDVIVHLRENLDLAPSDVLLSALPERLRDEEGREDRLWSALEDIRQDYDYIIVDCPPSVGLLTFNALKACSEAIIPVEPSFFSLQGIARQMETLDLLSRKSGHDIQVRALITLYNRRSEFARSVAEELRKHLGERSFKTVVRYSVKLPEAVGHGVPIADFSPHSAGFADYRALTREILELHSQQGVSTVVEEVVEEVLPQSLETEVVFEEPSLPPQMQTASPICMENGVLFTLDAPDALSVQLAGDFNGWTAEGNDMQSSGRVWSKLVPLAPGRYHYRFVVDGRWLTDPMNVNIAPAPWGGYNSVVYLETKNLQNSA